LAENATPIPDVEVEVEVEEVSGPMETQILRIPIEQQSGEWNLMFLELRVELST